MKEIAMLECCPPLLAEPLAADAAQELSDPLRALADPARLRILSIVAAHQDQEACVCELPEPLGLSQPTVSHHLTVLQTAGFLEREQRGVWAYYRRLSDRLELIRDVLAAS